MRPGGQATRIIVALVLGCVAASCGGAAASNLPLASVSSAASASTVPATSSREATSSSPATASSRPSSSSGDPVADARVADLAYLVAQLKAVHRNPFLDEGEPSFMSRVAAIEAKAGSLSDIGFLVAIMDLMGHRDRDGHSGAWAMTEPGNLLRAWPIWLYDFPDGLRIVAARS